MSSIELKLPLLHPAQAKVLSEARRFNVLRAGRRFGKSTLGRHLLIHEALKFRPACWVSPQYKTLANQWRETVDVLAPITTKTNVEERRIEIRGGGSVDFWSADGPAPGEGRKYSLAILDECAVLGADLERLWTRSLRPTLADFQGGAWFLSTSKAASSYFNVLFRYGQGEREDWKSWQLGTVENPFIAPSEVEAARRDLPAAAFAQEFLGDAVSFSGTVFTNLESSIVDGPLPDSYRQAVDPLEKWRTGALDFYVGVDWAGAGRKSTGDWTAFVTMASDGTVVDITRVKADYAAQREMLAAVVQRFKPAALLCEANSIGGPQIAALRASGLHVQAWQCTNATKHKAVEGLALRFEQNKIRLPDIPNRAALLGELMSYEAVPLPNGMTRFSAPPGAHDDLVQSLMIANLAATKSPAGWMPGRIV